MVEVVIPTFAEFVKDVPEEFMTDVVTEKLKKSLAKVTEMVSSNMVSLQRQGKRFDALICCLPAISRGSQFIADFAVRDLTKMVEAQYNFHGHNVSQVVINGCILFDTDMFAEDREHCVSIHT